jgi:hypothetical protein
MTESGTDVYLMPRDSTSPIPVAVGPGYDTMLGWSPDGQGILVRRSRTLEDGSFDADLWAYHFADGRTVTATPIDTGATRLIAEEAAWSPDGSRIAWAAQTGPTRQRDVFMGSADGTSLVNLTDNAGEDYHLSWSSDGNLLAFTSDRFGNPDLFALDLESPTRRLWRLTQSPDAEDFAMFSPDHRFVAYQSTAGGDAAVYVMLALGGTPTRVTPRGAQYSIAGWRGRPPSSHIDRIRVLGPITARLGDSVSISIFGADRSGNTIVPANTTIRVLDSTRATLARRVDSASGGDHRYTLVARQPGAVRVVASIPGWRYDTLNIQVGTGASPGLSDGFADGISPDRWLILGAPRPLIRRNSVGRLSLFPNGDAQWQSGVLSRDMIALGDSVGIAATIHAPFDGRPIAQALMMIALIGDHDAGSLDSVTPQLAPLVAVSWDGETSRITYSVGSEARSDAVSTLGSGSTHVVRIAIARSGQVSFEVDGRVRWTSSLRFLGDGRDEGARLWLGGRATGDRASFSDLRVSARR